MATNIKGKIGVAIIVSASFAYIATRLAGLAEDFQLLSAVAAVVEVLTLLTVCVECVLLATKTEAPARKHDAVAILESAKSVLFTEVAQQSAQAGGSVRLETQIGQEAKISKYQSETIDICVIVGEATTQDLRRSLLSIAIVENKATVYVVESAQREEYLELIENFGFESVSSISAINATTSQVLVCRGIDVIYPDACSIAQSYEIDENTFLELRNVYSDQKALGSNAAMGFDDKREKIREALATRGLSTWSTGPAIVNSQAFTKGAKARSIESFFHSLERAGVHGSLTEEVASEEILLEQTVSEVKWRAIDIAYTSKAFAHAYKTKGSKLIGGLVKVWSALTAVAAIRRLVIAGVVALYVLNPVHFEFVNSAYITSIVFVAACVALGSFLLGDKRGVSARIRETYFDQEAVAYLGYKSLISDKEANKSIVKKLPAVSFLLIASCAVLILRVYFQHQAGNDIALTQFQKNFSLFSGYLLLVSLLVGLGMVIVRQARATQRREVSRGANIDSEPVSMINLSPGGVGCVSVSAYEVGSKIQFSSSLPTREENTKFSCLAIVRSCVEWNDSYRIGLEFVELNQDQQDALETYCSIIYPHQQARESVTEAAQAKEKVVKVNGKAEKRFLSYAASFIALGSVIFINLSSWM